MQAIRTSTMQRMLCLQVAAEARKEAEQRRRAQSEAEAKIEKLRNLIKHEHEHLKYWEGVARAAGVTEEHAELPGRAPAVDGGVGSMGEWAVAMKEEAAPQPSPGRPGDGGGSAGQQSAAVGPVVGDEVSAPMAARDTDLQGSAAQRPPEVRLRRVGAVRSSVGLERGGDTGSGTPATAATRIHCLALPGPKWLDATPATADQAELSGLARLAGSAREHPPRRINVSCRSGGATPAGTTQGRQSKPSGWGPGLMQVVALLQPATRGDEPHSTSAAPSSPEASAVGSEAPPKAHRRLSITAQPLSVLADSRRAAPSSLAGESSASALGPASTPAGAPGVAGGALAGALPAPPLALDLEGAPLGFMDEDSRAALARSLLKADKWKKRRELVWCNPRDDEREIDADTKPAVFLRGMV